MSRFCLLLTPALALWSPLALANDANDSVVVPDPAAAPGASELPNMPPGASKAQRNHDVLSPTNPPDMRVTGGAGMSQNPPRSAGQETHLAIDPAQMQRVLGTDAALLDLASATRQQVLQLQQQLQKRGVYSGNLDGLPGPQTRAAISHLLARQHALSQRLLEQGRITGQLAASLGATPGAPSPVPEGAARDAESAK